MAKIETSGTVATSKGRAPPRATLSAVGSLLALWRWRQRYRRELSTLSLRQMTDAGLDPEVVWRESKKPFWDA
ncbi:MAG TPA: hypothetical protein VFI48_16750 [Hyphomicrobiaceae bacterium]|nr:hypothetical protein [Hyphomicrobiaceae bacterium]